MAEGLDEEAKRFFEQSAGETEGLGRVNLPLPKDYQDKLHANIREHFGNKAIFDKEYCEEPPVEGSYTDQSFPPSPSSLIKHWNMADIVSQVEWKDYIWRRLSETFPLSNLRVFDSIDPGDIQQGKLGDCYFLSTLSALAEYPPRIERLFPSAAIPTNCQYRVRILDLGKWKNYSLDDYFPTQNPDKTPAESKRPVNQAAPVAKDFFVFSGPKKTSGIVELWVCLLEKAWAKKYGSYYDIQSGFTDESLTDLTGAPCQTISKKSPRLWDKIKEADERKYIITGGCVGTGLAMEEQERYARLGLVVDHAYAVIEAKEVLIDGNAERLLRIRNPWGQFEWSGDWGDNSEKWTEAAKAAVGFAGSADDGTFWMCIDDFTKYFESVTICRYEEDFDNDHIAMDQTKDETFSVVQMTVSEPTRLYFMVCQLDERRFGGFESGYQYAPVRLVAARLEENGALTYIDGKISLYSRDAWIYLDLPAGHFLVYIEMNWKSSITDLFGVSVYRNHPVTLQDVTSAFPDFMNRCFTFDFVMSRTDKTVIFETSWLNCYCLRLFGAKSTGELQEGVYIDTYINASQDQLIQLSVRHEPWINCELLPPHHQGPTSTYQLQLKPGEGQVVLKKQVNLLEKHNFRMMMKRNFISMKSEEKA